MRQGLSRHFLLFTFSFTKGNRAGGTVLETRRFEHKRLVEESIDWVGEIRRSSEKGSLFRALSIELLSIELFTEIQYSPLRVLPFPSRP